MSLSQKRSVFCLIVFIICFLFKWAEMQKWNEVHLNNLVVATADSFHWLKEAQIIKSEDKTNPPSNFQLLPSLISIFAKDASIPQLKQSGNLLIPPSLSLSALAISLVASAGQVFSPIYLTVGLFAIFTPAIFARSYAGYIDTDMLNLFFIFSICFCIYIASTSKKTKNQFLSIGLAGLLNLLFYFWYHHALFTLLFLGSMLAAFYFKKHKAKSTLKLCLLFLLLSGTSALESFQIITTKIQSVFVVSAQNTQEQIGAATRYQLVTELQKVSVFDLPPLIYDLNIDPLSGFIFIILSLAGLFIWLKNDPLKIFCFAPLLVFLPLTLKSGIRFTFYSAPLFWIGLASIIFTLGTIFLKKFKIKKTIFIPSVFALVGTYFVFRQLNCINTQSACYSDLITLNFPSKEWLKVVPFFEKEQTNKDDVILAWWDHGYFIELATKARVVHSNQSSGNELSNFYAEALMKKNQKDSQQLFQAISNPQALSCANSNEECLLKLSKSPLPKRIYLIVDFGNLQKLPVSSLLSPSSKGRDISQLENFYSETTCKTDSTLLVCDELPVNLDNGKVNNKFQLAAYLKTDGEKVMQHKNYSSDGTHVLVENVKNGISTFHYVKSQYYYSTAGQLWFGFANKLYFNEVYNDANLLKVFEVIP